MVRGKTSDLDASNLWGRSRTVSRVRGRLGERKAPRSGNRNALAPDDKCPAKTTRRFVFLKLVIP